MGNKRLRPVDEVLVIAGNDRGKQVKILCRQDSRVVVEGVNVRKKHMKPTQQNQKGQIIDIECPIHMSNVIPSVEGKGVKLSARFNNAGKKNSYYLEEGKEILIPCCKETEG